MNELANTIASIPEGHFGLLIALTAVVGGLLIGGMAVWRGIWLHARIVETRSHLILEMLNQGVSSREILAILDHPSMTTLTGQQRKHSKAVLAMLEDHEKSAKKPLEKPILDAGKKQGNFQVMSQTMN